MELRQLEYFRAVARLGSVSSAARELHVSQPSLSMTLSRLEEDLGVKLFDRVGGKVILNRMGEDVLQNVDRVMLELGEIRNKAEDRAGAGSAEVSFGVSAAGFVMRLLNAYLDRYPPLVFRQYYQQRDALRTQLESGLLDFAISKDKIAGANIQWVPLAEDELLILVSRNHPLARRDTVYLSELIDYPFVLNHTDLSEDGDFSRLFSGYEQPPKLQFIGQEAAVVMEVMHRGLGVGLVSKLLLQSDTHRLMQSDMRALHIQGADTFRTLGVAKLKGRYLNASAQQFYEFTQEFFRSLAEV